MPNWETIFLVKVYRYSEDFSNHQVPAFFERRVLKEVRVLLYLHNNTTMLIQKFKNKVCTCKISLSNLVF